MSQHDSSDQQSHTDQEYCPSVTDSVYLFVSLVCDVIISWRGVGHVIVGAAAEGLEKRLELTTVSELV